MSIDRSLRVKNALTRHRNVLSRAERIEKLKEEEKWADGRSVLGLPKVSHRKSHAGKKAKEEGAEAAAGGVATPGAAAPAEGAAKAADAGKKAAAPAEKPAGGKKK
jgi:small basic protein (TIGR04137 family)